MTVDGSLARPTARKVAQCRHVDGAKLRQGGVDSCGEGVQRLRDIRREKLPLFRLNRRELLRREGAASGVGEEAVDDPGHVPHVECRRRDPGGAGVPFLLSQRFYDLAHALAHLQQNMRDRLEDGGNAVDRAALPPLGARHCHSAL
jgi:hypothetical protein